MRRIQTLVKVMRLFVCRARLTCVGDALIEGDVTVSPH